ncbi:hypothetical protein B0H14DRAFT_3525767 [Mycena olivaceomarginata]|nr:hypothetical protein B0H14DRAFT_3525767 [Mycena olivaceomarginata]
MSDPERRLSAELERKILSSLHDARTKSIPTLLLVARRVKMWLELILYSVVVFSDPIDGYSKSMDSFTTAKKIEDVVLPPVNEDGGTGSSGSCVVCKEDGSLPTINEDGGTGSSGSCVIA